MSVIESTKPGAFISLATAADILGISVHTLRRRIAAGELPAFRSGRPVSYTHLTLPTTYPV